jgi:hypothetical protein
VLRPSIGHRVYSHGVWPRDLDLPIQYGRRTLSEWKRIKGCSDDLRRDRSEWKSGWVRIQ